MEGNRAAKFVVIVDLLLEITVLNISSQFGQKYLYSLHHLEIVISFYNAKGSQKFESYLFVFHLLQRDADN